MADKIIIDNVAPAGVGDDLKGCYYKPKNDGTFDFFDKDGKVKARGLEAGSSFSFSLDELPDLEWTLTVSSIDNVKVNGTWTDSAMDRVVGEPDGTYQGQAGGGLDVENAVSASGY